MLRLLISGHVSNNSAESRSVAQTMTNLRGLLQTVEAQVNETLQATMSANENTLPLHVSANTPEAKRGSAHDSLMDKPKSTSSADASQISSAAHPQASGIPNSGHAPAMQRTSPAPALNVGTQPQVSEKPELTGKPRSAALDAAAKPPTGEDTVTIESSESEKEAPRVSKSKKTAIFKVIVAPERWAQVATRSISKDLDSQDFERKLMHLANTSYNQAFQPDVRRRFLDVVRQTFRGETS